MIPLRPAKANITEITNSLVSLTNREAALPLSFLWKSKITGMPIIHIKYPRIQI